MSDQAKFAAKVDDLIRQSRALAPEVRKRVMELLAETRKRVIGEVASLDPASFQHAQAVALRNSIDRAMDQFREQLTQTVTSAQQTAFKIGEGMVGDPLQAAGIPAPALGGVSSSALAIAQGYTADLISGLTRDSAAKVNAAIQRAFLGGQSMTDIVEQVGKALAGDEGFTGLFSPIGARAEMIATNEILRVQSIATQSRLTDVASRIPGMKKQWVHLPIARVPRIAHLHADGQVQEVNHPFDVGGEDLMYPRDPNGSAENTINCHCVVRPYMDAAAFAPNARNQKILKDLGISITASAG